MIFSFSFAIVIVTPFVRAIDLIIHGRHSKELANYSREIEVEEARRRNKRTTMSRIPIITVGGVLQLYNVKM